MINPFGQALSQQGGFQGQAPAQQGGFGFGGNTQQGAPSMQQPQGQMGYGGFGGGFGGGFQPQQFQPQQYQPQFQPQQYQQPMGYGGGYNPMFGGLGSLGFNPMMGPQFAQPMMYGPPMGYGGGYGPPMMYGPPMGYGGGYGYGGDYGPPMGMGRFGRGRQPMMDEGYGYGYGYGRQQRGGFQDAGPGAVGPGLDFSNLPGNAAMDNLQEQSSGPMPAISGSKYNQEMDALNAKRAAARQQMMQSGYDMRPRFDLTQSSMYGHAPDLDALARMQAQFAQNVNE